MKSFEAKIVVLGQQGVGKSSVIIRYLEGTFAKNLNPTIGASFFTCKMVLDDYRIKLQIWDTAGQERFRSMAPLYYRNANAALIIYDITSAESFEDVKIWIKELQKNTERKTAVCILGNKLDLKAERVITTEFAQDYATSINAIYFETSAASGEGISEALREVSRQLISLFEDSQSDFMVIDNYYGQQSPGHDRVNLDSTHPPGSPSAKKAPESKKGCCS